jgi:hypothetical protein
MAALMKRVVMYSSMDDLTLKVERLSSDLFTFDELAIN